MKDGNDTDDDCSKGSRTIGEFYYSLKFGIWQFR